MSGDDLAIVISVLAIVVSLGAASLGGATPPTPRESQDAGPWIQPQDGSDVAGPSIAVDVVVPITVTIGFMRQEGMRVGKPNTESVCGYPPGALVLRSASFNLSNPGVMRERWELIASQG